jgi:hypothetical protein
MPHIHGLYRLAPKVVAYRNDWCNHCGKPVLAKRWRSFYLGHLYWIPLLPLGFHETWRCTVCDNDPRGRVGTALGIILAGLFTCILVCSLTIVVPVKGDEVTVAWALRGIFGGFAVLFAFWLRSRLIEQPRPARKVEPLTNERCLICGGRMTDFPRWHCVECKVVRDGGEQFR